MFMPWCIIKYCTLLTGIIFINFVLLVAFKIYIRRGKILHQIVHSKKIFKLTWAIENVFYSIFPELEFCALFLF